MREVEDGGCGMGGGRDEWRGRELGGWTLNGDDWGLFGKEGRQIGRELGAFTTVPVGD